MSCENPPGSAEATMPRRRKLDKSGICIKCKTTPGKVVIRHAVYCKACFLVLITSKFRHVLDPTVNDPDARTLARGALKASGNLMIGFSGGLGSTTLLDLVRRCYYSQDDTGKSRGGKKHPRKSGKVWDRVIVCYVECCEGRQNARDRSEDVKSALQAYEDIAEIHILRLEDAFKISTPDTRPIYADISREDLPVSKSQTSEVPPTTLLKSYIASLPTATSHQSSISSLTRLLLQYAARTHGCSHLLLGTSLTSLSVNLIDAVASGAGFTVGLEKAEDWQSDDSEVLRIVRPLREVSMKECAAYSRWRDLSVIGNERLLAGPRNVKESIGDLTKEFIFGLERDYPSTVSAIVRTCDKLVSNTEGSKCVLCERPAQADVQDWKERISIRRIDGGVDTAPLSGDAETLTTQLCYACHTTLTSRSSRGARRTPGSGDDFQSVRFPAWVGRNIESNKHQNRADMKAQIQDFLLDENNEDSGR